MSSKYIFTRNEYAKLLGVTVNCIRLRMRRGKLVDECIFINGKWMFKQPSTTGLNLTSGRLK